jgi:hypothetical protein
MTGPRRGGRGPGFNPYTQWLGEARSRGWLSIQPQIATENGKKKARRLLSAANASAHSSTQLSRRRRPQFFGDPRAMISPPAEVAKPPNPARPWARAADPGRRNFSGPARAKAHGLNPRIRWPPAGAGRARLPFPRTPPMEG